MTSPQKSRHPRLPKWLRRPTPPVAAADSVRQLLDELGLATVCTSAKCPNRSECFARRTATFMILGASCTRSCRFCAVDSSGGEPIRPDEPQAVARACEEMGLRHIVITSVTRDDLPDGGAGHFARVCREVRRRLPSATIEILTPDFLGRRESVETVLTGAGKPDIFNHNIETVWRLYPTVRPEGDYRRSLDVLAMSASVDGVGTKSGVMVGLGETRDELRQAMCDLLEVGCEILTVGQYLAPSPQHLPVIRYLEPDEFDDIEIQARQLGFLAVAAGPFVRSSYRAEDVYNAARLSNTRHSDTRTN